MCRRMVAAQSVVAIVATAWAQHGNLSKPKALLAMEEARKSILSGRIEWEALPEGDADRAMSFVSRFARNGDEIFEIRGDPEGWTVFGGAGQTSGILKYPQIYLHNGEGYWHHQETGTGVEVWLNSGESDWPNAYPGQMKQIRAVGISDRSASVEYERGFDAIWDDSADEITRWEQRQVGQKYVVVAQRRSGATTRWEIDPQLGWNAERVVSEFPFPSPLPGGRTKATREALCVLERFGETWFPRRTDYYSDGELVDSVIVKEASISQPNDPARFTLADMGVESGMGVSIQNPTPEMGGHIPRKWNGAEIVTTKQFMADMAAGKCNWGPIFQRINQTGRFESPYDTPQQRRGREIRMARMGSVTSQARHKGLWEKYVEQFIKKYDLNEEQKQRAHAVLEDCQRQANRIRAEASEEWGDLDVMIKEARAQSQPERVRQLTERQEALLKPIEKIFEQYLKPRLEKLPTRAQRRATESSESATP